MARGITMAYFNQKSLQKIPKSPLRFCEQMISLKKDQKRRERVQEKNPKQTPKLSQAFAVRGEL